VGDHPHHSPAAQGRPGGYPHMDWMDVAVSPAIRLTPACLVVLAGEHERIPRRPPDKNR
jgi:hypothetical protein